MLCGFIFAWEFLNINKQLIKIYINNLNYRCNMRYPTLFVGYSYSHSVVSSFLLLGDFDLTNLKKGFLWEFPLNRVKSVGLSLGYEFAELFGTRTDFRFSIFGALGNLGVPGVLQLEDLGSEVDSRGSSVTGSILQEAILNQSKLNKVSSHHIGFFINPHQLWVTLEEQVRGGDSYVEVQRFENLSLHRENLLLGIGLIRHVHKISQVGRIDLFILTGNEHRSDTHELELLPAHFCLFEITINKIHGEE